jgi:hypothetical protein
MRPSLSAACGLVIGIAGHVAWSEYSSRLSASAVALPAPGALPACKPDSQRVRKEVRRAVREAVHEPTPNPLVEALSTGVVLAQAPVAETEDNRQARAEQNALIDAAIRAGRWTDDDVTKFRAILPRLSATERPKALVGISRVIDEHRFKVEAAVPF